MKKTYKSIGSFDAKTHLSRVLEEVENGEEYVITRRGKPVARLTRFTEKSGVPAVKDLIVRFDEIRNAKKGTVRVKDYVEEGRNR